LPLYRAAGVPIDNPVDGVVIEVESLDDRAILRRSLIAAIGEYADPVSACIGKHTYSNCVPWKGARWSSLSRALPTAGNRAAPSAGYCGRPRFRALSAHAPPHERKWAATTGRPGSAFEMPSR
jgi:hypothetical protein